MKPANMTYHIYKEGLKLVGGGGGLPVKVLNLPWGFWSSCFLVHFLFSV